MRVGWIGITALLAGCSAGTTPYWAMDPITLYPQRGGLHGIESWELFSEGWGRHFNQRFYVCGIVVELNGTETTPCDRCTQAWSVQTSLVETDCADGVADDAHYLALDAIGIGDSLPDVTGKVPYEGQSSGAWASYGDGWEAYGWAYPKALDDGDSVQDAAWDGTKPFALLPAYAWQIQ